MGERVAVLGAGVGGMTAAHELAERGFEVHVYERRKIPGGKARSFKGPDGLPAEHGFRFFPGFYKHVRDTMERIPYAGQRRGVLGNLKPARNVQLFQRVGDPIIFPTRLWRWDTVWLRSIRFGSPHFFTSTTGLARDDVVFVGGLLRKLLKACAERRFAMFEMENWWDFSGAAGRSEQYQRMLRGLSRSLVAARAEELSVRTGGYILLQLQLAGLRWRGDVPSVLNGPTNSVWIRPWERHLLGLGVEFHLGQTVEEIHCLGGRIHEVIVTDDQGKSEVVKAHWYVSALPAEVMRELVTPAMARTDPGLGNLGKLQLRWMNGILFYLRKDVRMVHGHSIYVDSPWALTSISQKQFWDGGQLGSLGDVQVSGILSVDVSDWETDGVLFHKPAMRCTQHEIEAEVLAQIRQHLAGTDWAHALDDENIAGTFLDDAIVFPNPGEAAVNLEPLLINTVGSWAHRPSAVTKIDNLFLASDYVRTHTDLASMEGANEAGRRAVNGILDRSHSGARPCEVWPLRDPGGVFAWWRRMDRARLRRVNLPAFEHASELIDQLAERLQRLKR
jgi:15-cis-phytoene desaturase